MTIMKKLGQEIFKSRNQGLVDQGKNVSWSLHKAIIPIGTEAYGSHITFSMYNDVNQLAENMEGMAGEMDMMTQLAINEGLKNQAIERSQNSQAGKIG